MSGGRRGAGTHGTAEHALPLSPAARKTQRKVISLLKDLQRRGYESCLCSEFREAYGRFLLLFERFQTEVLAAEGRVPSCRRGCATCCFHWVEDVYSFEAALIGDHIVRHMRDEIPRITRLCREDVRAMEDLESHGSRVFDASAAQRAREGAEFDLVDLLLGAFYRLRRPCPLLGKDGACLIYDLRPLTCRIYVSFSPPARCDPEHRDDEDIPTVLLDLEEEANALLDELHFRYDSYGGDTGLRSLLLQCLES
jgi:Fe-S-cluster containining protein